MKKSIVISVIFISIVLSGYSQVEKNTILLGGYTNFIFNTGGSTYFSLDPNSGFFISDKFCLGISVPVIYVSEEFYWGFTPFTRYYFKEKDKNSIFMSGALGLTSLLESENTISPGLISIGIGHVWFLNKCVGFETQLKVGTSFNDVSIGVHFGFQIYLNKKSE